MRWCESTDTPKGGCVFAKHRWVSLYLGKVQRCKGPVIHPIYTGQEAQHKKKANRYGKWMPPRFARSASPGKWSKQECKGLIKPSGSSQACMNCSARRSVASDMRIVATRMYVDCPECTYVGCT